MTAALHYSTAWSLPIVVAAIVGGLRPLSWIGDMEQWLWFPPERGLAAVASVIAGFGILMWWFLLARLAATAPPDTRTRVAAWLGFGAPIILVVVACGWWWSLEFGTRHLFALLHLTF